VSETLPPAFAVAGLASIVGRFSSLYYTGP
jgi:hypothetical protein